MAKEPRHSAAEWKRESGKWHNWAEKHWDETGQKPFAQPRDKDSAVESPIVAPTAHPELKQDTL